MNNPNFENIDRWLFDYVEGNLSSKQESMLENYILNHPELEVDLDMWRMSNIKTSKAFVNDVQIVKKTVSRKIFHFINTIGIIIILLIGRQIHEIDSNFSNGDGQLHQASTELNTIDPSNLNYSNTQNVEHERRNLSSEASAENNISNTQKTNKVSIQEFAYEESDQNKRHTSSSELQEFMISECAIDMNIEKLHINQTTAFKYTKNFAFNDEEVKEQSNQKNRSKQISFKNSAKKLMNNIDQALSKNLGLSNYRDHNYLIPEISSLDANLSMTGSVSQSRIQSISRLRWINTDQHKLSQQLSFDTYARGIRSGIGAQVNYDYYADGTIQDWNGALILSPKIAMSRNIYLEPVAKLKIGNKLLDASKVENNSIALFNTNSPQNFSYDTTQNIGRKLWYRDVDIGLTLNTKMFYIGAQASNFLNHSEDIYQNGDNENYRTPTTYSFFAGTQYVSRNEKLSFQPYVYVRSIQSNRDYFAGFSIDLNHLYIGASLDFQDQYTGSIGLALDRFALIVQSTRSLNPLMNEHLYTHQLTLRINSDISKKTRRYITF